MCFTHQRSHTDDVSISESFILYLGRRTFRVYQPGSCCVLKYTITLQMIGVDRHNNDPLV